MKLLINLILPTPETAMRWWDEIRDGRWYEMVDVIRLSDQLPIYNLSSYWVYY